MTSDARTLGHACGFEFAKAGVDTGALQAYLGHRNIQRTVRYTELAPDRFKGVLARLRSLGSRPARAFDGWR